MNTISQLIEGEQYHKLNLVRCSEYRPPGSVSSFYAPISKHVKVFLDVVVTDDDIKVLHSLGAIPFTVTLNGIKHTFILENAWDNVPERITLDVLSSCIDNVYPELVSLFAYFKMPRHPTIIVPMCSDASYAV